MKMDSSYICTMPFFVMACSAVNPYLRYLPFDRLLSEKKKFILFHVYALIFCMEAMIGTLYVVNFPENYDAGLITWWPLLPCLSFLLANLILIPHEIFRHLFVLGMDILYALFLHTLAGNLFLHFLPLSGRGIIIDYPWYPAVVFGLSILFLPLVRPFFLDLFRFRLPKTTGFWQLLCLPVFGIFGLEIYDLARRGLLLSEVNWLERIEGYALALFLGWAIHEGQIIFDKYDRKREEKEKARFRLHALLEMAENTGNTEILLLPLRKDLSALTPEEPFGNKTLRECLDEDLLKFKTEKICFNEKILKGLLPILTDGNNRIRLKLEIPEDIREEKSLALALRYLAEETLHASGARRLTITGKLFEDKAAILLSAPCRYEVQREDNFPTRMLRLFLTHHDAKIDRKWENGMLHVVLECKVNRY